MTATTNSIPEPTGPSGSVSSGAVHAGLPIPPIERIRIFSPAQWEEFVLEWLNSLIGEYERVERCGGAGDMGRDVIGFTDNNDGPWDNYQCKHYTAPLAPGDIWLELGKLVYYTKRGDFSCPRKYFFVAPQGAGTKLSNLLRKPDELRSQLFKVWDKQCSERITKTETVPLDTALREYINKLDFSIFSAVPPLRIIDQHARTRWHVYRFGGGLRQRPSPTPPPPDLADVEANYVRALLDAYADCLKTEVKSLEDLGEKLFRNHFSDARTEFYSAESLRVFSRDVLPPGEYEGLQKEFLTGIMDEVRSPHSDGYQRVLATTKLARSLQVTNHALCGHLSQMDRGGICHQLANDEKVTWVSGHE